jgi:acyl carrier protein
MELVEIKDRVRTFVLNSKVGDNDSIHDDTHLFKEGFYDSIRFLSLIAFLEEHFNIHLSDNDLIENYFESIDAISVFIVDKTNIS